MFCEIVTSDPKKKCEGVTLWLWGKERGRETDLISGNGERRWEGGGGPHQLIRWFSPLLFCRRKTPALPTPNQRALRHFYELLVTKYVFYINGYISLHKIIFFPKTSYWQIMCGVLKFDCHPTPISYLLWKQLCQNFNSIFYLWKGTNNKILLVYQKQEKMWNINLNLRTKLNWTKWFTDTISNSDIDRI